jgi:small-conductance mechanosensitive channel
MKSLLSYLFIIFLFIGISSGEDFNYLSKENNSWLQVYSNLLKTQALDDEIKSLEKEIQNSSGQKKVELKQLLTLQLSKKKILDELPRSFDEVLEKITIGKAVKEINIIEYLFTSQKDIFATQTKKLNFLKQQYNEAVSYLEKELVIVNGQENKDLIKEAELKKALTYFENTKGLLEGKEEVLKRTRELYTGSLKEYEQTQLLSNILNMAGLLLIFVIFYTAKYFITKRIEDEEKFFKVRKVLDISFFVIILFIIIIFNINNIIYAATLIGVIAAAMTITMKEYLQSMTAWLQLTFGNYIKVGDRIMVNVNNIPVTGEIIAISLFKTTLYENINNTTSSQLKFAGRIIFIPNNFFVNNHIYNYTHDKMKTIYDLIELSVSFGVDTQKVEAIVMEVAHEMTDRYMEVASKQFLSMKQRYDMRSREFRPRVHFIADAKETCFTLRVWYVAPNHQIMELKSQLSQKIVKRLQEEGIDFCNKL